MRPDEFSAVHPAEYLKDGPLDDQGRLREGLNGELSLAMAYRLRHESVTADQLKALVDKVKVVGEQHMPKLGQGSVSEKAKAAMQTIWSGHETGALAELRDAVQGRMTGEWKDFAALALHLERIMRQLALISLPPPL